MGAAFLWLRVGDGEADQCLDRERRQPWLALAPI